MMGQQTLRVATYNIHKGVQGLGPARRLEIHNYSVFNRQNSQNSFEQLLQTFWVIVFNSFSIYTVWRIANT